MLVIDDSARAQRQLRFASPAPSVPLNIHVEVVLHVYNHWPLKALFIVQVSGQN